MSEIINKTVLTDINISFDAETGDLLRVTQREAVIFLDSETGEYVPNMNYFKDPEAVDLTNDKVNAVLGDALVKALQRNAVLESLLKDK